MVADFFVYLYQLLVGNAVVLVSQTLSDDVGVYLCHKVLQQRTTGVVKEVAAVFSSVGNNLVHFIQLLAADEVCNKRCLVEGLVVGTLWLDSCINHGFKCQLYTSLNHSHHQDTIVKVFLLSNFHITSGSLLKCSLSSSLTPCQQVLVIVCPVNHHNTAEFTSNNVVHVLLVQGSHNCLQLLGKGIGLDFGRIRQAIHHSSDSAPLESLGNGFPTVLNQLGSIALVQSLFYHAVKAQDTSCLEHSAENGLLTHEVGLNLCHKA